MRFKWDWEQKELAPAEEENEGTKEWYDFFFVGSLIYFGWYFIQHIAPYLGHLFFGGFL